MEGAQEGQGVSMQTPCTPTTTVTDGRQSVDLGLQLASAVPLLSTARPERLS